MPETIVINTAPKNPTLEETAKEMGIDPKTLDSAATGQMADPIKPKVEDVPNKNNKDTNGDSADDATDEDEVDDDQDEDEDGLDDEDGDTDTDEETDKTESKEQEVKPQDREKVKEVVDELSAKFWSNGQKLDEADYSKLEEVGYDKRTVDAFIEGQKAVVELARMKVFTEVGGESRYTQMLDWAKDTLSDAEIKEYNKAVNSNDMDAVLFAVKNLKSRYQGENGNPARRKVAGKAKAGGGAPGYTSLADMQADMSNPRYQTDPVFRQRVERKLASSNIL